MALTVQALDHLVVQVSVAKLDQLSRHVHFVSGLMAHRVPFLVAELGPDGSRSCCTLYAALHRRRSACHCRG